MLTMQVAWQGLGSMNRDEGAVREPAPPRSGRPRSVIMKGFFARFRRQQAAWQEELDSKSVKRRKRQRTDPDVHEEGQDRAEGCAPLPDGRHQQFSVPHEAGRSEAPRGATENHEHDQDAQGGAEDVSAAPRADDAGATGRLGVLGNWGDDDGISPDRSVVNISGSRYSLPVYSLTADSFCMDVGADDVSVDDGNNHGGSKPQDHEDAEIAVGARAAHEDAACRFQRVSTVELLHDAACVEEVCSHLEYERATLPPGSYRRVMREMALELLKRDEQEYVLGSAVSGSSRGSGLAHVHDTQLAYLCQDMAEKAIGALPASAKVVGVGDEVMMSIAQAVQVHLADQGLVG